MKNCPKLLFGPIAAAILLSLPMAGRAEDTSTDRPAAVTPPPADLHYIEGVWKPGGGGAPPPAAAGAPGGAPPGGAPGPSGVTTVKGTQAPRTPETADSVAGSGLVCAPENSMRGAGGGMSDLWIESPREIVMINEENQDFRQIYLQAHHPKHLVPQVNGNSIGHWEGNTLVVDTTGYADKNGKAIDQHIVEHIRRDGMKMIDQATITSNGRVTQQEFQQDWRPDLQVWENICEEGYSKFQLVNGHVDDVNN